MGASDFSKLPHIGEPLLRREDERFLTGAGQYTDDITLGAQTYAVFVRSPHAHARLRSVNIDAAKAAAAQQTAAKYPENQTRPEGAQGALFGVGRTIAPGDKDYNRGSLNPKLR